MGGGAILTYIRVSIRYSVKCFVNTCSRRFNNILRTLFGICKRPQEVMLERNLCKWWSWDQTPSKSLLVRWMGDKEPVKDIITINFLILELPRNANLIVDIRFNLYYYIYVHYY